MAIEAASAKRRVAPYGFEHFPGPVDVFSSEEEEDNGEGPIQEQALGSDASSDKVIEHELVYPPKPFPGEDLNHDWIAMMLNEQHDVHLQASARLQQVRKDVDGAAAELMKLKYELNEERDAFQKMLERLENIMGADELASVVELMPRGIEHGTFDVSDHGSGDEAGDEASDDEQAANADSGARCLDHERDANHEDDGQVAKSNGTTESAGYDAEDEESDEEALVRSSDIEDVEQMEEWRHRAEYEENLPDQFAAERIWNLHDKEHEAETHQKIGESRENSGDDGGHAPDPCSSPSRRSPSAVPGVSPSFFLPNPRSVLHQQDANLHDLTQSSASESRDKSSGHPSSSPKIATNGVRKDLHVASSNRGSLSDAQVGPIDLQDTAQFPKQASPTEGREESPNALSYTSGSDHSEQREEVAPLLSPIHLSDPEPDTVTQVPVSAGSSQHSSPTNLSSASRSSPARARSASSSPSPASFPILHRVEQVVVTMDATEPTTHPEATASPLPADRSITPPASQPPNIVSPESAASIEFVSANFDLSQYRGPITTKKRGRARGGFEAEASPSKRPRYDRDDGVSPPASPDKTSKSPVAPMPTPAAAAATSVATQDSTTVSSEFFFAPLSSAFETSKRALSFNSRLNAKK